MESLGRAVRRPRCHTPPAGQPSTAARRHTSSAVGRWQPASSLLVARQPRAGHSLVGPPARSVERLATRRRAALGWQHRHPSSPNAAPHKLHTSPLRARSPRPFRAARRLRAASKEAKGRKAARNRRVTARNGRVRQRAELDRASSCDGLSSGFKLAPQASPRRLRSRPSCVRACAAPAAAARNGRVQQRARIT